MTTSANAATVATEIAGAKLGDIKRRAAEIGTDHDLAMELWAMGALSARLLSVLVLDKMRLTHDAIGALAADILELDDVEGAQIADWPLANQLMKDKKNCVPSYLPEFIRIEVAKRAS